MPNAAKTPPTNAPIGAHAITPGPHINPAAAPPATEPAIPESAIAPFF